MAEIKLVTQNDEPALALGEYLLSEDGETLYVGSAGVESGSSEVIYKGISPAQIKSGVFSKLPVIGCTLNAKYTSPNITYNNSVLTSSVVSNIHTSYNSAILTLTKGE